MFKNISIDPKQIKFNDRFNIIIPVDSESLGLKDVALFANEHGFIAKKEFHLTLIGGAVGFELKKLLTDNPELKKQIEELIGKVEWIFVPVHKYFRVSKEYIQKDGFKEQRQSIIQEVETDSLDRFYLLLNDLLHTKFDAPYPHVTLFVKTNHPNGAKEGIGISSRDDFSKLDVSPIKLEMVKIDKGKEVFHIKKIQLPTRPQVDTIIALFILRQYARDKYIGLDEAEVICDPISPIGKSSQDLLKEGILQIDVGGGDFDHHTSSVPTASHAVARFLGVDEDPPLQKLLKLAQRSDQEGKGTLSQDPLDRAFGFDGMVMALNKTNQKNPHVVIDSMMPLIEAHYEEQYKQSVGMPELWQRLIQEQKATVEVANINGKKNKIAFFESEDSSLPGFLRAHKGEKCELIFQRLPSGHVNVMTKMNNGLDLKPLVHVIRKSELLIQGTHVSDEIDLEKEGRIEDVPEWYYDTVTNSILNGGLNPQSVKATQIPWQSFPKIVRRIWG